MARGVRATTKQRVAGRHNLVRAQVNRIGTRGKKYQPRRPR